METLFEKKENLPPAPKYLMATILMPIEVKNMEENDFVCLHDYSRVSLQFCKELPVKDTEIYKGLSVKIDELYDNYKETGLTGMESVGVDVGEVGEVEAKRNGKTVKRNITYRQFRENKKSHRYTSKEFHV